MSGDNFKLNSAISLLCFTRCQQAYMADKHDNTHMNFGTSGLLFPCFANKSFYQNTEILLLNYY